MKPDESLNAIKTEFNSAVKLYKPFNSNHEGYAVIKEELDELWDEIKASKGINGNDKMRKEAVQIGAMAVRFLNDLC